MRKLLLPLILLSLSTAVGAQTNPVIYRLSPDHIPAGSTGFTLTIEGDHLVFFCHVLWDNVMLSSPTCLSSRVITVPIPQANVAAIGTHSVVVTGLSVPPTLALAFKVLTPLAVIGPYTPTSFVSGQDTFIDIFGPEFVSNATILFDWQPITTTFVSSGEVSGTIPGSQIGTNYPHQIAVYNGAFPGGSITYVTPNLNAGTISTTAPQLNFVNSGVLRDSVGNITLGTPWSVLTGNADFSLGTSTCVDALAMIPNQFCTYTINFVPTGTGVETATLTIMSTATNSPQVVNISGTGSNANTMTVLPTSLNFGSLAIGATGNLTLMVDASFGIFTMGTPYYTLSGSGDYAVTGGSCTAGGTIACTIVVSLAPTGSAGSRSGTIAVNSGADNSPISISLTGSAVTAVSHHVSLNWTASTSASVAGYNIYRSTFGGSFGSPLNGGTPVVGTTYTDTTVVAGTTYIYGVTTVGVNPPWMIGQESMMVVTGSVTP